MLRKYKPNIDTYFDSHSLEIIEELLNGMWDAEKFTQFFEANVEFMTNGNTTNNYDLFIKSLEYIRVKTFFFSNFNWQIKNFVFFFLEKVLEAK